MESVLRSSMMRRGRLMESPGTDRLQSNSPITTDLRPQRSAVANQPITGISKCTISSKHSIRCTYYSTKITTSLMSNNFELCVMAESKFWAGFEGSMAFLDVRVVLIRLKSQQSLDHTPRTLLLTVMRHDFRPVINHLTPMSS